MCCCSLKNDGALLFAHAVFRFCKPCWLCHSKVITNIDNMPDHLKGEASGSKSQNLNVTQHSNFSNIDPEIPQSRVPQRLVLRLHIKRYKQKDNRINRLPIVLHLKYPLR